MTEAVSLARAREELRAAFATFDKDGSGKLSVDELVDVFTRPGGKQAMNEAEARAFVAKHDKDGDGELDLDEFVHAMLPGTSPSPAAAPPTSFVLPEGSTWHKNGGAVLDPLFGCTFVVCVRWLLKFVLKLVMPERNGVVPAWQDLPADAEVRLEDLYKSKMEYGLPILVLSYGWSSKARTPCPISARHRKRASPLPDFLVRVGMRVPDLRVSEL